MTTISFPDKTPGDASVLAQDLRQILLADGVPAESLSLFTSDPEAMSGPVFLNLDMDTLVKIVAVLTLELPLMSLHIAEFLRRTRARITFTTKHGDMTIEAPRSEIQPAAELIQKVLRDEQQV